MDYYSMAPRRDNPKEILGHIIISEKQYEFLENLELYNCNRAIAWKEWLKIHPMSKEAIREWMGDYNFIATVNSLCAMEARSKILKPKFIKDKIVAAMGGIEYVTKTQMQAINAGMRVLGIGASTSKGKVSVGDDRVEITWQDGPTPQVEQENPATGLLGPLNGPIQGTLEDKSNGK